MRMARIKVAGLRAPSWWVVLLAFATLARAADPFPPATENVGELGQGARLVFDGNQTFSRENFLGTLTATLEFHARSHPGAPLAEFLNWIEQTLRRGYQRAGFAKASLSVTADRAAQHVRVRITEGPRFQCGDVRISGLDDELTTRLRRRLDQAATNSAVVSTGSPPLRWSWPEGRPAPTDALSLDASKQTVAAALGEMNRHDSEVEVEPAFDESRRRADLLVRIVKPGVPGVLDRIEVTGLQANTRDDVLKFLDLRPGVDAPGSLASDIARRLWESARFLSQSATLSPLTEPGRLRLGLEVTESPDLPALKLPLTAEQEAFLKLREWILGWPKRGEDWVVESTPNQGEHHLGTTIVLGHNGLAVVVRQAAPTREPALEYAAVAVPGSIAFYSGQQRQKLVGGGFRGQIQAAITLGAHPPDTEGRSRDLMVGAFLAPAREPAEAPFAVWFELTPAAFLLFRRDFDGACQVEDGVLSARTAPGLEKEPMELAADAKTGRLIRWSGGGEQGTRWQVRSEAGALVRVRRQIDETTAAFTHAQGPKFPYTSAVAFLIADALAWAAAWGSGLQPSVEGAAAPTGPRVFGALRDLPWGYLLEPLERSWFGGPRHDDAEDFPFVPEASALSQLSWQEWLALWGGWVLRANDAVWPRGSWPWAIVRDATLIVAGKSRLAATELEAVAQAEDTGPLACLVAVRVFGRLDPELAVPFARQGALRATSEALLRDLRALLGDETTGAEVSRRILTCSKYWQQEDLPALEPVWGADLLPLWREASAALVADRDLSPVEAFRPAVERRWTQSLGPALLTTFAQAGLAAAEASAAPSAAEVASNTAQTLLEAAEAGYPKAQMLVAQLYRQGVGVRRDPLVAAFWLRRAGEQHYPHAACDLARLYVAGEGVTQDLGEAARWFRQEAELGCPAAMIGLGNILCAEATATPERRAEGRAWLQKAADQDHAVAALRLAILCEQEGDTEQALRWYRQAAEQGSNQAQMTLGERLSEGMNTAPDYAEAWIWFKRAEAQGHKLAALEARRVGKRLTPEQQEQASRLLEAALRKAAGSRNPARGLLDPRPAPSGPPK